MGTHYRGTRKETRALDAFIKLARASDSVMARAGAAAREAGLTESQFGAMETLYHLGPMCQRLLGEKILKSGGNITMVVDNLEALGFAERIRDSKDRRYVTVRLTRRGRAKIARTFPKAVKKIVREMSALTAPEQDELSRLLKKLGLGEGAGSPENGRKPRR